VRDEIQLEKMEEKPTENSFGKKELED